MPYQNLEGSDIYGVTRRLIELRTVLRRGPHNVAQIIAALPDAYTADRDGKRQVRRDLENLRALGYALERTGHPSVWHLVGEAASPSDADLRVLQLLRDSFGPQHPLAPQIKQFIERHTSLLAPAQQRQWAQPSVLRLALKPAIDYRQCEPLIVWLQEAIQANVQIELEYAARDSPGFLLHPRLDPYELEYSEGHFYLQAFSYRSGTPLQLRLDRIRWSSDTPRRLATPQAQRQQRPQISFVYELPASFASSGVSERFTIYGVERAGDVVRIAASDSSEFRIVRILLGYGEHARLVSGPTSLMEQMRETVRQMAAHYGKI